LFIISSIVLGDLLLVCISLCVRWIWFKWLEHTLTHFNQGISQFICWDICNRKLVDSGENSFWRFELLEVKLQFGFSWSFNSFEGFRVSK
jgi:hypothetical protein